MFGFCEFISVKLSKQNIVFTRVFFNKFKKVVECMQFLGFKTTYCKLPTNSVVTAWRPVARHGNNSNEVRRFINLILFFYGSLSGPYRIHTNATSCKIKMPLGNVHSNLKYKPREYFLRQKTAYQTKEKITEKRKTQRMLILFAKSSVLVTHE